MREFIIDKEDINKYSHTGWKDSVDFKSKDRIVDRRGKSKEQETIYDGRTYQVIAKKEREFSKWKRVIRILHAIWIIVSSFGKQWSSKQVKNLFKDHESKHFGMMKVDETATDFTVFFPEEMIREIFLILDEREINVCLKVNKKWRSFAQPLKDSYFLKKHAFGKQQWAEYLGDIGEEPPLPKNIVEILKGPCPFWPEKKVVDTHMLVLIPKTINNIPCNLSNLLLENLQKIPCIIDSGFYGFTQEQKSSYFDELVSHSHWVLMTKYMLEESKGKNYSAQEAIVAEYTKKIGINYEIPTLLDAIVCIIMHPLQSRKRLFIDTFLRFKENNPGRPLCINTHNPLHPYITSIFHFKDPKAGMAVLRRFLCY